MANNPRKFSEKIALQKQKQAEGTAEFEKIMKEVYATKMDESQVNQRNLDCCLSPEGACGSVGGNVGNGGGGITTSDGGGRRTPGSGSPTAYRERGRSVGVGPMRRPSDRKVDRSPYGSNCNNSGSGSATCTSVSQNIAYLSPPIDTNWRRSNSDSAIHQSLNLAVVTVGAAGMSGAGMQTGDLAQSPYSHQSQRSHSPNINSTVGPSPTAQRKKLAHGGSITANFLQQQHQQLQQQQQQHIQHQHHIQSQQQFQQMQQQQQQQQQFNATSQKFFNLNPTNSLFKTLQDQANMANTGSLPDLTSVHFAPQQQQLLHHQQQQAQQPDQQQHQQLSPILSPHNNRGGGQGTDLEQSPQSPFSPTGNGSSYPNQPSQHSPTSSSQHQQQSSPHLSFTNLSVQQPIRTSHRPGTRAINIPGQPQANAITTTNTSISNSLHSSYGHLPSIGITSANSTGNLTEYRNPMNPPSPGSSPGLLTSVSVGSEIHSSASNSPIRHPQQRQPSPHLLQQQPHQQAAYSDKNIQTFERFSPSDNYNSLNSSFHNHFEQFSLGDSSNSSAVAAAVAAAAAEQQLQQYQQQHQHQQQQQSPQTSQANNFALEFESMFGNTNSQLHYSQALVQNKLVDLNALTPMGSPVRSAPNGSGNNLGLNAGNSGTNTRKSNTSHSSNSQHICNNNGPNQTSGRTLGNNNNNSGGGLNTSDHSCTATNNSSNNNRNNNSNLVNDSAATIRHQQQHRHQTIGGGGGSESGHTSTMPASATANQSGSPSSSTPSSPLAIPIPTQSPHHTMTLAAGSPHSTNSLSTSSSAATLSGTTASSAGMATSTSAASGAAICNTAANIPSIIFSDYSSNSDFSREIFDTLDLDLGQMDVAGLQMLSDPNNIMIADPTIEDSFRRDLT